MKESKVKGKVWLPAYIRRNPKIQQMFKAEPRRKTRKGIVTERINRVAG